MTRKYLMKIDEKLKEKTEKELDIKIYYDGTFQHTKSKKWWIINIKNGEVLQEAQFDLIYDNWLFKKDKKWWLANIETWKILVKPFADLITDEWWYKIWEKFVWYINFETWKINQRN